ncbi:MAG TPA: diacylglycerol kinase family protein [Spirochaetia bacterium]|nr:diacylglycerol kinase family protein [Spirochaetia bacterium]
MDLKQIDEFYRGIVRVLSFAERLKKTPYRVDVIVNPVAGRIARHGTLHQDLGVVRAFVERLHRLREESGRLDEPLVEPSAALHISESPGHAAAIAAGILERIGRTGEDSPIRRNLVVSVGGDGTHEEVLSVIYGSSAAVLDRLEIFRVPMGTGNDSADALEVAEACDILFQGADGKRIGALRVKPRGLPALYSFNIASIGIDAYITYLTNRLKSVIPGDVYKILADVATLFYNPRYRDEPMTIVARARSGEVETLRGRFILVAVGVSGHRVYGGAKPVLPGEENLCAMSQVGILRKLRLKEMFYAGTHVLQPETHMLNARRITISYDGRIPLQVDGEAIWLEPANFPLEIEVLEPRIHVLTHAGNPGQNPEAGQSKS